MHYVIFLKLPKKDTGVIVICQNCLEAHLKLDHTVYITKNLILLVTTRSSRKHFH